MAGNDILRFYYPWPAYGVKMSRQWPNVRENFQALAPLVRAAYVDLQPASAHDAGENDLSGWAIGERDFRNKFRIWYDKTDDTFKIQYNNGTEAVPAWNDAIQIRESDLRVTITGSGGVAAPTGGFYTDIPRQLAVSRDFALSTEWQFQHNLGARPIIWDTFRSNYQSIVPAKVDVSDPNRAYFYFSSPVAGTAIAVAEQARGNGINFTDGSNVYYNKLVLNVSSTNFYLSRNLQGNPVLNLKPVDLSESQHSTLLNLTADDHPQYALTDGSRNITGPQIFNDSIRVNEHVETAGSFYSDAFGEVAYADQGYLSVTQTNGSPEFTTVNKITFAQESFYLTSDSEGKPVVNFRGASGSGGGGQFGTGIQSQTFSSATEWQFNHGLGVNQIIWAVYDDQGEAIIPDKIDASNNSTMFFYFTEAVAGRAVVAGGPLVNTVTVEESDGTPTYNTGTIKFSSADFYIESDTSGNPIINARSGGSVGSGSGVSDHGALTGLVDDDHTQYLLTDGTRAVSGVMVGVDPILSTHLATKAYVDSLAGQFYGVNFRETDGGPDFRNDTIYFDSASFYLHPNSIGKPVVSFRGTAGVIDHGALSGLSDDDHSQYLLASDATNRSTFASNWVDLTDGGSTVLHSHPGSGSGGGFYGIYVRETDGSPPTFTNDTITFDSASFYLYSDSVGKPVVAFKGDLDSSTALAQNYGILAEWEFAHNLNTDNLVWSTYDNRQKAIIPHQVDISNPNIAYFYFIPAIAGRAVLIGGLGTAGTVGTASGITSVTDGSSTYNNQVKLNFSGRDFYLSHGGQAGSAVVNLTSRYIEHIPAFIETASVMNLNVDPWAPYSYRIKAASIDCREGSCSGGFYLLPYAERADNLVWKGHSTGISIAGLDPISISTTPQELTPSTDTDVSRGDCLIFSVGANSAAKWIRILLEVERL